MLMLLRRKPRSDPHARTHALATRNSLHSSDAMRAHTSLFFLSSAPGKKPFF